MPGKVFISHSSKDNDLCKPLISALDAWGVFYWYDNTHLTPGDQLSYEITKAIQECDIFLRICTPATMASEWMSKERDWFFKTQGGVGRAVSVISRRFIPLHLAEDYEPDEQEKDFKFISTVGRTKDEWLDELRVALSVETPPRMRREPPFPVSPTHNQTAQVRAMLKEMDAAIGAELTVKKRNTWGHVATDGKFIGKAGGQNLYTFTLSEPWEPQDDAPIRVVIRSQPEVNGNVVNSTGVKITIAIDQELLADALRSIKLIDDPSGLLEKLREVLPDVREPVTQLASKAFQLAPPYIGSEPGDPLPNDFKPTLSQRLAIEKALGSDVSYIIGPPGTGKTATLAAIAYALIKQGRSVLIAAHTNIAVDNAILKLADFAALLPELRDGRIIRFGAPQLDGVKNHAHIYPPNIAKCVGQELDARKTGIQSSLGLLRYQLGELEGVPGAAVKQWRRERDQLSHDIREANAELWPLQQQEQARMTRLRQQLEQATRGAHDAGQHVTSAKRTLEQLVGQQARRTGECNHLQAQKTHWESQLLAAKKMGAIERFFKGINPDVIARQVANAQFHLWQANQHLAALTQQVASANGERARTEQVYTQLAAQCAALNNELSQPSPFAARIQALQQTIQQAQSRIAEGDAAQAEQTKGQTAQRQAIQQEMNRFNAELAAIETQLANIERDIVDNAQVVATTLTKVYMRTTLRERQFDVLILDEASIAPLPTAYVAATVATQKVVVIGDPRQLAPIFSASNDPNARKWLGRDLFEVAGVTLDGAATHSDARAVLLDEQFRMNPAISIIARKHVYENLLYDSRSLKDGRVYDVTMPRPGQPLVLCDTSDGNPQTTRPESGRSRFNTYHILCVVALAKHVLATLPPAMRVMDGSEFRIGIVTPYAPQARKFQQALKEEKLADRVRAGTIHRFQGLQAEVVIFDTVESLPLDPRADFTVGAIGTAAMRLVNVAVTRPQHKLIIVANLPYLRDRLSKNDILMLAVEEAYKASVVMSADILKLGQQ